MKEKVIVTGASGFVGRHVVLKLINNGYDVTSIVRDIEKAKKISQLTSSKIIQFDINTNKKLPFEDCGANIIHCAWDNVRDSINFIHLEEYFYSHLKFLKECLNIGIKKIIVTGSCYEYGLQYGPISADQYTMPNTPYGLSKDMLHKSLRLLALEKEFKLIWARLFYNYGDGQESKAIVSLFDTAIERGDDVFNMSFGEQIFDYLPIEETADQLVKLLIVDQGVFNICSAKPISLRRFLENRMKEKNKYIKLNFGHYPYRKLDSIAIWGKDSFETQTNF